MSDDEDETRLNRWSRRKREMAARRADDAPARNDQAEDHASDESEADILDRLGLPDPATLTAGDDFSVFLRADVPASLRRRATRMLWRADPALARLDGLVDYDDDYTDAATVPETLRTAWKIGSGFADVGTEIPAPDPEPPPEEPTPEEPAPQAQEIAEPEETPTQHPALEAARPAPRRMRFTLPQEGEQ